MATSIPGGLLTGTPVALSLSFLLPTPLPPEMGRADVLMRSEQDVPSNENSTRQQVERIHLQN